MNKRSCTNDPAESCWAGYSSNSIITKTILTKNFHFASEKQNDTMILISPRKFYPDAHFGSKSYTWRGREKLSKNELQFVILLDANCNQKYIKNQNMFN